jgi:hypothetical protein
MNKVGSQLIATTDAKQVKRFIFSVYFLVLYDHLKECNTE